MCLVLSEHVALVESDNLSQGARLQVELEAALGRSLPQPSWHQVVRERRATFSCRPDLPRPAAQTPLSGLWLAGDYTCAEYPATLEGAVRSGVAAAKGAGGRIMP